MSSTTPFRVLVLGGAGNFGQRICEALAPTPGIEVIAAGRRAVAQLTRGAQLMQGAQNHRYVTLDANDPDLANYLQREKINLVIHTAGPFNASTCAVAEAAVTAGCHYADLADDRDHVCRIHKMDSAAKAANIDVISGVSSVPALTSAVVDAFSSRFAELDRIECGISASELTPGTAAVKSVLDNVGKPHDHWQEGCWEETSGWAAWRYFGFAKPLGRRWVANVNVPDLELFPQRYPGVGSVTFKAGVAMWPSMIGTGIVALLVKQGWLDNPTDYAKLLARMAGWLEPLGSGRSGLYVELSGLDHDRIATTITWQLVAHNNDGPWVPCIPAVVLAQQLASDPLPSGAYPCVGLLSLTQLLDGLAGLHIETHLDIKRG